jgi:hypothetical protein
MAKSAKAVANLERPSVSGLKIKAGMLLYRDTPVPGNKLDVIVVGSAFLRTYYEDRYDANNIKAPNCFSLSLDGEDMVPHENIEEPINPTCAGCPNDKWGSDPHSPSKKGKACKEMRRFIVIPANAVAEDNVRTAEMATIRIPVMSVKNWGNYVNEIATAYSRPPWGMLTEISVVPNQRSQWEVKFTPKGIVEEKYLADVWGRFETAKQLLLTPYDETEEAPKEEKKEKKNAKY